MKQELTMNKHAQYIKLNQRKRPILKHGKGSSGRRLSAVRISEILKCPECQLNPVVLITAKKIPVCDKHWEKLADSIIEWGET